MEEADAAGAVGEPEAEEEGTERVLVMVEQHDTLGGTTTSPGWLLAVELVDPRVKSDCSHAVLGRPNTRAARRLAREDSFVVVAVERRWSDSPDRKMRGKKPNMYAKEKRAPRASDSEVMMKV